MFSYSAKKDRSAFSIKTMLYIGIILTAIVASGLVLHWQSQRLLSDTNAQITQDVNITSASIQKSFSTFSDVVWQAAKNGDDNIVNRYGASSTSLQIAPKEENTKPVSAIPTLRVFRNQRISQPTNELHMVIGAQVALTNILAN